MGMDKPALAALAKSQCSLLPNWVNNFYPKSPLPQVLNFFIISSDKQPSRMSQGGKIRNQSKIFIPTRNSPLNVGTIDDLRCWIACLISITRCTSKKFYLYEDGVKNNLEMKGDLLQVIESRTQRSKLKKKNKIRKHKCYTQWWKCIGQWINLLYIR